MPSAATLPLQSNVRELRFDGFSLTVVQGPDKGAVLRAKAPEASVGTAQGNDLVLTDRNVSRHHVSVTATPEGFLVRDLGSSNGTHVGGVRLREGLVEEGARLKLGQTVLQIDLDGEEIREALSAEDRFGVLLGASSAMRRIFAALPRIAQSDTTVLLEGETGTGKGVLASAIHEASARASGPFVVLDCTAVAPSLIESELFGHVRGAFTGAAGDRAGAFEQAAGGTIFIDEIGELPLDMQPKLLRALEERTVKRVGGNQRIKLDARVIAATNRDLRAEVNRGAFRADLYYRLNVVRLQVPPLRERTGDIERLARHFHAEIAPDRTLAPELIEAFVRQPWPGNVRELRAAVERAVLFDDPAMMGLDEGAVREAPASAGDDAELRLPFRVAKQRAADAWESRWVRALFESTGGNVSEASRVARMDRSHLRSLLKKYGIKGGEGGD